MGVNFSNEPASTSLLHNLGRLDYWSLDLSPDPLFGVRPFTERTWTVLQPGALEMGPRQLKRGLSVAAFGGSILLLANPVS
jgi:hypothetical protein